MFVSIYGVCCVFWPVNRCFPHRSLVFIIFFGGLTSLRYHKWKKAKKAQKRKKSQKTEKGVYQHLGATNKTLKIIILIREQHAKHPLTGPNTQQCPFLSVKAILRTQLWAVFAILRQSLQGAFKNTHYFDLLLEAFKFKNLFLPQYKDKFTTCPLASKMF